MRRPGVWGGISGEHYERSPVALCAIKKREWIGLIKTCSLVVEIYKTKHKNCINLVYILTIHIKMNCIHSPFLSLTSLREVKIVHICIPTAATKSDTEARPVV